MLFNATSLEAMLEAGPENVRNGYVEPLRWASDGTLAAGAGARELGEVEN